MYKSALWLVLFTSGAVIAPAMAAENDQHCQVGDAFTQTTLYYGTTWKNGQPITPEEWNSYLSADVTPRFKDGLTVFDANGQWMNRKGDVTRQTSKAVLIVHQGDKDSSQRIEELRDIYKKRFQQESVMRVDEPVCASF